MKTVKKIGLILLNILTAGAGFGYLGYPLVSAIIQACVILLTLTMGYLATFSPLVLIAAVLLNLIYTVFTVWLTLRLLNKSSIRSTKWLCLFLLSSFLLLPLISLLRPSTSYKMSHNQWEPHLFEGELFLVQHRPKKYLLNDFVIIKKDNDSILVRRIQKIEGNEVELSLSLENNSVEKIKIETLAGKVLYVWYPKSFDRFLKYVN